MGIPFDVHQIYTRLRFRTNDWSHLNCLNMFYKSHGKGLIGFFIPDFAGTKIK